MTYTEVNAILTDRDPATHRRSTATLVPLFERMHELFEILNARRRRRGSIDFDLKEAGDRARRRGAGRGRSSPPSATSRTGSSRSSCCWRTRPSREHLDEQRRAGALPRPRRAGPAEGREFEEFISTLGYSLGAPRERVRPRHFQKLVERMRGKPEEKPIAFLMLRTMQKARYDAVEPRPLRPGGDELHAFHVADPPLSRTWSSTARCASRGTAR